jgi:sucrose phosphorylase
MALPPEAPAIQMRIHDLLTGLYGEKIAEATAARIFTLAARFSSAKPPGAAHELTEKDAVLITYADQVSEPGKAPLQTLAGFCRAHLSGTVSAIHILPFYPWTSDDGFSVKDYFAVAPEYGSWEDIADLARDFDLMFDAVFNHMSAQSDWFKRFLADDPAFRDFFVTVEGNPDLSRVVRPRTLPLLTEFQTARGLEKVWTTFSADQVDLNARNPAVLTALLEALLFYAAEGARFIRLDAIAYLWKEIGTACIHLPKTHAVIQLMRALLDLAAPHVKLITETNVPHRDNISYFGDGRNEAQLVYNFALPPLVLHALLRGDASYLNQWASGLAAPTPETAFFNFLASHDGIGLNPARGILPEAEIGFLVERCQAHGGFINYKQNADGSSSPYEMNIVYFDALNDPASSEPLQTQADRFVTAHAIMLALSGVPGIYFHSLTGSRNDRQAAIESGINRRINRQKLAAAPLAAELDLPGHLRNVVFGRLTELLRVRRAHSAFSPRAAQQVVSMGDGIFAVLRTDAAKPEQILCVHNMTGKEIPLELPPGMTGSKTDWRDIIPTTSASHHSPVPGCLKPYQTRWLLNLEEHGIASGVGPRIRTFL